MGKTKSLTVSVFLWAATIIPLGRTVAIAETTVEIPEAAAAQNLITKVEPVYPAIAKAARIEGDVRVAVVISKEGMVESAKLISGNPLLTTAAMVAVKRWKYKPFVSEGQPTTVRTEILVRFSLGISNPDYKCEEETSREYFSQDRQCRDSLKAGKFDEAESSCRAAVQTAERLPHERQMERLTAYQMLGHSLGFQEKFNDALTAYQEELDIAQATLQPDEAELGYAYRDVALASYATGDPQRALGLFDKAIRTLEQAHNHIGSAFLKNEYSRTLKTVLQQYAIALRQQGDNSRADAMDQKASAIVVKDNIKVD